MVDISLVVTKVRQSGIDNYNIPYKSVVAIFMADLIADTLGRIDENIVFYYMVCSCTVLDSDSYTEIIVNVVIG